MASKTLRAPRFFLVQTACRRCGKALLTGNRPLVGTAAMQARYAEICEACFTAEEREQMEHDYRHLFTHR